MNSIKNRFFNQLTPRLVRFSRRVVKSLLVLLAFFAFLRVLMQPLRLMTTFDGPFQLSAEVAFFLILHISILFFLWWLLWVWAQFLCQQIKFGKLMVVALSILVSWDVANGIFWGLLGRNLSLAWRQTAFALAIIIFGLIIGTVFTRKFLKLSAKVSFLITAINYVCLIPIWYLFMFIIGQTL